MSKLEGVHLKENESEKWVWNLESFGIYSVKPTYKCIMSDGKNRTEEVFLKIWHKFIPLKVAVFSWQVLQDRITLKVNLFKRAGGSYLAKIRTAVVIADWQRQQSIFCSNILFILPFGTNWLGIRSVFHIDGKIHLCYFLDLVQSGRVSNDKLATL